MIAERFQMRRQKMDQQSLDNFLAAVFRHPMRIAILHTINSQPEGISYKGLTELLVPTTAENIARHLRILRRVGAIVPHVGENVNSITYVLADSPNTRALRAMLDAVETKTHEYLWLDMDLLRSVISAIPEAIVLVGAKGEFLLVNDVAQRLWAHPIPDNIHSEEFAVIST